MKDVADRLKKNHQSSVIQILRAQPSCGTYLIDKNTFINFLQSRWIQLDINSAYELYYDFAFVVEPNMNYRGNPNDMVDLLKFETEIQKIIFQDEKEREEFMKQFKDPKKIEQLYSDLKIAVDRYQKKQGKTIYDVFEMFDKDHSLSLDLKEFITGLDKIGTGFQIEELELLFMQLDVDKSGSIRYIEFFDILQHHFLKGAFNDRNHWLFFVFEHIRRSYYKLNKSMQVIFKAAEPKNGESLIVEWKTFLSTLKEVFQQVFNQEEEHELKALVESPTKKDYVDLNEFQQLLGLTEYKKMEKEAAFFQDKQASYASKNTGKVSFQETQNAVLQVVERLVTHSLKEQNIRDELYPRGQANAIKDHTDIKSFKEHLQILCTKNYKNAKKQDDLPQKVLDIVAGICASKEKADLINYEEFILLYLSQVGLLHSLQFLFFNLGTIMKKNNFTVLSEVIIKNGAVLATSKTFNKDQFKECLKKLNLNLHDFEVDQIMNYFDLTGKGQNADFANLNNEYERMTKIQYQQDVFGHLDGIPVRPSEIQHYKSISDEEVFEKLIRAFNGDDEFIKAEGEKLDLQKAKAIAPNQFAALLIGADAKLTQIQIEQCLTKFGADKIQKSLVNIQDFVNAFSKKRDTLKIAKGKFKALIGTSKSTDQSKPSINPAPNNQSQGLLGEKEQILKNIHSRIQERCKINKIDLQKIFADAELKERGVKDGKAYKFTGFIKKVEFYNLLKTNQIDLYTGEDTILDKKYYNLDKAFPLCVNYQEFVTNVLQEGNAGVKLKLNLTAEQQSALTNIQRSVNKDATILPLFTKELKLLDKKNSNCVEVQKVLDCFTNVKVNITQKLVDVLLSCIKIEKGAVKIHELLQLLNEKDADDLFNANIRQLENGTWKKQSNMKKSYAAGTQKFELPKQVVGASDKFFEAIGNKLILSNCNYEAVLFEGISEPKNIAHPLITLKELNESFTKLKISLGIEEKRYVESFFKDFQDGTTEKVNLCDLLKSFGLPAQTFGERAAKMIAKKVDFILSDKELKSIHSLIVKIKRECEKLKVKTDKLVEDCKVKKDDLTIDPTRLLKVLQDTLKKEFVKNLGIDENIDNFILYTSENVGDRTISVKKLLLALQRTEKDEPLKQSGVDDIKDYERGIKAKMEMSSGQQELDNFLEYMKKNNKFLNDIVPSNSKAMSIPEGEFSKALVRLGYNPTDFDNLVSVLATTTEVKGHHNISVTKLKDYLTKGKQQKKTAEFAKNRILDMPPKVRKALDNIQSYIKTKAMTVDELHKKLDTDGDGKVTKKEFITEMTKLLIPQIVPSDLGEIFDRLDVNQDRSLTVSEFSMYLKGVELNREARIKKIDQEILKEINEDVVNLFKQFDEDGNGKLQAQEIFLTLQSFGVKKSLADCEQLIRTVTKGLSTLDKSQFIELIQPMMIDQLLNQNQQVQDLRKLFMEADVDGSGMLSVEELYAALKKLGAEVQIDDIVSLMAQIDVDRDGELDIDEFVSLMTAGDQLQEIDNDGKNTLMKINKARRVDPLTFLKIFKNMPQNFVPSFVKENWKAENLLPSQVFKAQVDPKTMLWKDVRDVRSDHDLKNFENKQGQRPYLRPIETSTGCKLILKEATGVPLPKVDSKSTFKDDHIVKRVVRIGFASSKKDKKDFLHHIVQVPAQWSKDNEDIWKFSEKQMSEVFFRTTKQDQDEVGNNANIIFELCVYVKQNEQSDEVTEMSCGWCELDMKDISRGFTAQLPIKGGSPEAEVSINDNEVRAERSGFSFIKKVVAGGKIEKCLEVQIQPFQKIESFEQTHLSLLPSTCFIQRQLLYFVSAFMNYKAQKLLQEGQSGTFKKPSGDVIISCFPKIFDCPDILEELTQVWMEDVEPDLRKQNKILNIDYQIERMKDYINRLYPILYSEPFRYNELNGWYQSLCGSDKNLTERKKLVRVALRNAQLHSVAKKENESVDSLVSFTPFSVRELEYEVWDTRRTKQDQFFNKFK